MRYQWQVQLMLFAIAMLAAAAQPELNRPANPFDFSRSYVVWISEDRGQCSFFMTDVGLDAKELTETLRENYRSAAGIEILTSPDTPKRCVPVAQRAVKKAGFIHYRVRLGTDADRSPGIP